MNLQQSSEGLLLHWHDALISWVKSDVPDLTNRQMALLMAVRLDPRPHTVRGLASQLGVAKPAITRNLDKLCQLQYVKRTIDKRDRRNVFIAIADAGVEFLDEITTARSLSN